MGQCPICNLQIYSTAEAGDTLGVTDSRIRALIDRSRPRLPAARVGWGWMVPAPAVDKFEPQPSGVHNTSAGVPVFAGAGAACPRCGERFLNVRQAARALGITKSGIYAILGRWPDRLQAVRVGHRWYLPESGIAAYDATRSHGRPTEAPPLLDSPPHPGLEKPSSPDRQPHIVHEHLRQLPDDWQASQQALSRAGEHGLTVPPGFTFVQLHERNVHAHDSAGPATETESA